MERARDEEVARIPVRERPEELHACLRCGILAHGFARIRCDSCGHERLLAFICKGRGVCPSCNTRRMAEVAAHLTDRVLPWLPVRHRIDAVSFPHRFGSSLNVHFHYHVVVLDGVFSATEEGRVEFHEPSEHAHEPVPHPLCWHARSLGARHLLKPISPQPSAFNAVLVQAECPSYLGLQTQRAFEFPSVGQAVKTHLSYALSAVVLTASFRCFRRPARENQENPG